MSHERLRTVVFICTANYYRSRFSEYLFNALAAERGLSWRATSRGLKTWMADGQGPISSYTVDWLTARGIPHDAERFPISLSEEDLERADLVVAVKKAEHRAMMLEQFPAWADRIEYWHVDDIDCAAPEETLPACEAGVKALVERLAAEERKARRPKRRAVA
jgi:protein-tyrosine phosphatase